MSEEGGYLTERKVFGQGDYGRACEVCGANDYLGPIEHAAGCREVTEHVKKLRRSLKDATAERET
jgi:hypothetical protein